MFQFLFCPEQLTEYNKIFEILGGNFNKFKYATTYFIASSVLSGFIPYEYASLI